MGVEFDNKFGLTYVKDEPVNVELYEKEYRISVSDDDWFVVRHNPNSPYHYITVESQMVGWKRIDEMVNLYKGLIEGLEKLKKELDK